eukprot:Rmarinus@m.7989
MESPCSWTSSSLKSNSFAAVVADLLERMVDHNAPAMSVKELTRFGMVNDPFKMPLVDFVEAMLEVCTPFEIVCGLMYVRRLLHAPPTFLDSDSFPALTRYNVHRIMFTAVALANVQWSDIPFSSDAWAQWSTVWSRARVNRMKVLFLREIDWRLHLHPSDFETAVAELCALSEA